MKNKAIIRLLLLIAVVFGASTWSGAQMNPEHKCYVVVGAFKFKMNAENFSAWVESKGLSVDFKLNTYRNLYYVYSYESKDREATKQELFRVREKYPDLYKAWLYAGNFKGPHIPAGEWMVTAPIIDEPVIDQPDEPEDTAEEPGVTNQEVDEAVAVEEEENLAPAEEEDDGLYWKLYINAVNASNFKEVGGKFSLFDAERNQKITEIPTHELYKVEDPNNRTNRVRLESEIFGYHSIRHTFDLDEPLKGDSSSIISMQGDTIVVNLKMQRLRKGDISTLWKVYFYKDAAIMKEESIYELNQLLDMMQENENVEITIHGHTNGNSHGPVLHLDLDDKQFFSLNGSHEETVASAKKLSLYRAYTIQHWLMAQGIPEERMEIKGWGGKKMIYDKFDSQAEKNVRVEIEVTAE